MAEIAAEQQGKVDNISDAMKSLRGLAGDLAASASTLTASMERLVEGQNSLRAIVEKRGAAV